MPGGDKTGPNGAGVGTGRRAGFCYGNNQPGYASAPNQYGAGRQNREGGFRGFRGRQGQGRGLGRGQGIGFRNTGNQQDTSTELLAQVIEELKDQNRQIAKTLNDVKTELESLKSGQE